MGEARKQRSEEKLRELELKINPSLPPIEDEETAKLRSPEEIVRRAICALLAANVAIDIGSGADQDKSVEFFMGTVKRFGLENDLTADERKIFGTPREVSMDDACMMSWRIEMCMPLLYACGFVEEPGYPSDVSDTVPIVRMIVNSKDMAELMSHVKMRSLTEVLDRADLMYRMDWACVEARIHGYEVGGGLDPEVVVEQHKGYNWLINAYDAEDWDTVVPNT